MLGQDAVDLCRQDKDDDNNVRNPIKRCKHRHRPVQLWGLISIHLIT